MSHPGGHPPHFSTCDSLQLKCDEYFEYVKGEFHIENGIKTDKEGNTEVVPTKIWDREPENLTITGLALFLGFESRQSVYDYEKRGEFSYIIKTARLKVENGYENKLMSVNVTGSIFALKNMGWTDKQEVDHRSGDGSMSPTPIKFTKGSK